MVEHDKDPEIVGAKSKGTVLKAKSGFFGDKGEKPFKGLHREDPTRTVAQRGLSPFLEERRDRGEQTKTQIGKHKSKSAIAFAETPGGESVPTVRWFPTDPTVPRLCGGSRRIPPCPDQNRLKPP